MIYVALAAGLLLSLLLVLQHRERAAHSAQIALLLRKTELERSALIERVQHPERIPVEPGPPVEYDPPKDGEALAQVGQVFYDDGE